MASPQAEKEVGGKSTNDDNYHQQPLFCHLVRIGSYRAVAAVAGEPAVTAVVEPNAVLYLDRLELVLRDLPRLVLHQQDIRYGRWVTPII